MLRDNGQIHQLQSAGKSDRNGGPGDERKSGGAAQGDPVVLDIEGFFDEVDVFVRRVRAGCIRQAGT